MSEELIELSDVDLGLTPESVPVFIDEEAPTAPTPVEKDPEVLRAIIARLTIDYPYRYALHQGDRKDPPYHLVPNNGGEMRCFFCEEKRGERHRDTCSWVWARKAIGK